MTNCSLQPVLSGTTRPRKRLDFVFFDAGGGHRSAANALKAVIEQQGRPWEIRLVNLQEILDSLDIFRKYTGIRMQDVYNVMLQKGWTLGSAQMTALMHGLIRLYHGGQVRLLTRILEAGRARSGGFADPEFQSRLAREPSRHAAGDDLDGPGRLSSALLDRTSGSIFDLRHRESGGAGARAGASGRAHLSDLGNDFAPELLSTGDGGSRGGTPQAGPGSGFADRTGAVRRPRVERDAGNRETRDAPRAQFIFICGRNKKLAERLRGMQTKFPKYVEEFTSEIPYYMHLSDFFVGKPGPGSISEAIAMRLPVVVERNAWTLPQERYNTEWICEKQVGVVLPSFRAIDAGLRELLEAANLRPLSSERGGHHEPGSF